MSKKIDGIKQVKKKARRREVVLRSIEEAEKGSEKSNSIFKAGLEKMDKAIFSGSVREEAVVKASRPVFKEEKVNKRMSDVIKNEDVAKRRKRAKISKREREHKKEVACLKKQIKTEKERMIIAQEEEDRRSEKRRRKYRKIEKKRKARERVIKEYKTKLKKSLRRVQENIFLYGATVLFLYIFSSFLVLRILPNTRLSYYASKIIAVPAIISEDGVIFFSKYYKTRKVLEERYRGDISNREILFNLIKEIKAEKIARRFGLECPEKGLGDKEFVRKLSRHVIRDEDLNRVAVSRIFNIKEVITAGSDFDDIGNRHGDSAGELNLDFDKEYVFDVYELAKIDIDEVSEVIIMDDGYYIFKRQESTPAVLSLRYIFVGALNVNEYMDSTMSDYDMLNLVK